jgi:hypothetical protein
MKRSRRLIELQDGSPILHVEFDVSAYHAVQRVGQ